MGNLDQKYHESVHESVDRLRVSEFNHKRTLDTLRNSVEHLGVQFKSSNQEYSGDLQRLQDKYKQEMDNVMYNKETVLNNLGLK